MIQGVLTALITPFRDGQVDLDQLAGNVRFQIEHGVSGLVPTGTTGESPTLSHEEHRQVIEKVVEAAAGRVKVVAGTGSNATTEALALTTHAKSVGADAALMVNPYYNKPSQEGLYRHFMTVADAVDIPIVLYNIPGRTGVALSIDTVVRLAKHPNIVAIKEATGCLDMASEVVARCAGDSLGVLSGDDSLTLPIMAVGGCGVVSVASNLVPDRVVAMVRAASAGDFAGARKIHLGLFSLIKALFIETNPIPIKVAMRLAGMDRGEFRLPLCEMSAAHDAALERELRAQKIL